MDGSGGGDDAKVPTSTLSILLPSLLAGLATGIGGIIAVCMGGAPRPARMAFVLSFAAGVMATVSVLDMWLPTVIDAVAAGSSLVWAASWTLGCVAVGAGGFLALSRAMPQDLEPPQLLAEYFTLLPANDSKKKHADERPPPSPLKAFADAPAAPLSDSSGGGLGNRRRSSSISRLEMGRRRNSSIQHLQQLLQEEQAKEANAQHLQQAADLQLQPELLHRSASSKSINTRPQARASQWRLAIIMMVTMTLHNLPEGVAVLASAFRSPQLGMVMALAIALHNIPEGLTIAVPVLAATSNATLAILLSFLSGLTEPLGALVAFGVLGRAAGAAHLDAVLCTVAGVMMAVCCAELLPEAYAEANKGRDTNPEIAQKRQWYIIPGFCLGCITIAATLVVLT